MWYGDMRNTACQSITGELLTTHHVCKGGGGEGDYMCCVIESGVFRWRVINLERCADRDHHESVHGWALMRLHNVVYVSRYLSKKLLFFFMVCMWPLTTCAGLLNKHGTLR